MLVAYSKPCQISKMIRHVENLGIVRTVYLAIFRQIQGHSTIFSHVQAYWGTSRYIQALLKHIQTLLRHIELYWDIFRTLYNPCIYNHAIFRILPHLEPDASSKVCQICKIIRYIQSPGIVRIVYSSILKDI